MITAVIAWLLPVAVLLLVGFASGALVVWGFQLERPRYRRTGA